MLTASQEQSQIFENSRYKLSFFSLLLTVDSDGERLVEMPLQKNWSHQESGEEQVQGSSGRDPQRGLAASQPRDCCVVQHDSAPYSKPGSGAHRRLGQHPLTSQARHWDRSHEGSKLLEDFQSPFHIYRKIYLIWISVFFIDVVYSM